MAVTPVADVDGALIGAAELAREAAMEGRGNRVLVFDTFSVDLDAAVIRRDGEPVAVEPQVFDLIALLCTNPGRLLGHDEIIEQVWRGRVVSDSAVASSMNGARRAMGDDGRAQRCIRTVRGRGFRFELTPTGEAPSSAGAAYVLSVSPHGYALLMHARAGSPRQEWREALPALLATTTGAHRGSVVAPRVAVFACADDALECAVELVTVVGAHCQALPREERWTVKTGGAHAALRDGWAYTLAGRLDAAARPGGICLTAADHDVDTEPVAVGPGLDEVSVVEVTQIGDRTLLAGPGQALAQLEIIDIPEPAAASCAAASRSSPARPSTCTRPPAGSG